MGLLQIFTRRPGKAKRHEGIVQQPHGATTLQGYPSFGNNQQLSRTSFNYSDDSDAGAPAPFVHTLPPSLRERPGTSSSWNSNYSVNTGHSKMTQRPPREPRRPPVSFRKPSLVSLSQAYRNPSYSGDDRSEVGTFDGTHGRSNSITSTSSRMSRQSRDLLDVLEEIRPVEFRTRVLASGVKDYGEDVADRNIRQTLEWSSNPNSRGHFDPMRDCSPSRPSRRGSILSGNRTRSLGPFNSVHLTYGNREGSEPTLQETSSLADDGDHGEPDSFSSRRNRNRLSLNTYTPSGLDSPRTPRSAVSTPGLREGMDHRDFGSTSAEPERRYLVSPIGYNFSVPRSPRIIHNLELDRQISRHDTADLRGNHMGEQELGEASTSDLANHGHRSEASIGHVSLAKAGVRFSNQTFRSSLASSVTSRHSSMDFTPLGYPRYRSHSNLGTHRPNERDISPSRRTMSLSSHRPSRSTSSEDGFRFSRTKSLMLSGAPSGLRNLLEIEERDVPLHSSGHRDWSLATPSNGSITSSSHAYSGGSGGGRPGSRHTKATSVDSDHHSDPLSRKSDDSFRSALTSHEPGSAGWSPTDFNIDDYLSSDEESFDGIEVRPKRSRRAKAEGEEELLFRGALGFNGALPGLLAPIGEDACPPPVVSRFRSTPSWERSPVEEEEDEEDEDDKVSMDRDMPVTLIPMLRHTRSTPDTLNLGTFGRMGTKSVADVLRLAAEERDRAAGIIPATATTNNKETTRPLHETPAPHRHQKHLSALGTPHGRTLGSATSLENLNNLGGFTRSGSKTRVAASVDGDTIEEEIEKLDHPAAVRLWRSAKARKRAKDAESIREKRLTSAFGGGEVAAALKARENVGGREVVRRGRTLVR